MASYVFGNLIRLTGTFTLASNGTPTDPSVVKLSVITPAGVKTTYTYGVDAIVKDSTGVYHYDLDVEAAGTWQYRWWSTGTGEAANESTFTVRSSSFF